MYKIVEEFPGEYVDKNRKGDFLIKGNRSFYFLEPSTIISNLPVLGSITKP